MKKREIAIGAVLALNSALLASGAVLRFTSRAPMVESSQVPSVSAMKGRRTDHMPTRKILLSVKTPAPAPTPLSNGNTELKIVRSNQECKANMARVEGFCIDMFEASLAIDGSALAQHNKVPIIGTASPIAVSYPNVLPQGHITHESAGKACANAGKRLCNLEEWQRACKGPEGFNYPYGNTADLVSCNTGKNSPPIESIVFPNNKGLDAQALNDPKFGTIPGYLAKNGGYGKCKSAEGVMDLVGNLMEWVAEKGLVGGGVLAGSNYGQSGAEGCSKTTDASEGSHAYYTGFRCCDGIGKKKMTGEIRKTEAEKKLTSKIEKKEGWKYSKPRYLAKNCPPGMSGIGKKVCMDRWEAHVVCNGTVNPNNKAPPSKMKGCKAGTSATVLPQGHISQIRAAIACRAAGKRLCTSDEWRNAFAGQVYPYGNTYERGSCNVGLVEQHPLVHFFPNTPHMRRPGKQYNDPRFHEYVGLALGNRFPKCVSPLGIFHLSGNLSEWTDDFKMKKVDVKGVLSGIRGDLLRFMEENKGNRVMGRFCGDRMTDTKERGVWYCVTAHDFRYYDYSTGYRCCTDVKK